MSASNSLILQFFKRPKVGGQILALPLKADGTPDLAGIVFEPPQAQWNVSGARAVVKGAATLDGPWGDVPAGGNPAYRFFKVEVVLP